MYAPRNATSANIVTESSQKVITYLFMRGRTQTNDHFLVMFVAKLLGDKTIFVITNTFIIKVNLSNVIFVRKDFVKLELFPFTKLDTPTKKLKSQE